MRQCRKSQSYLVFGTVKNFVVTPGGGGGGYIAVSVVVRIMLSFLTIPRGPIRHHGRSSRCHCHIQPVLLLLVVVSLAVGNVLRRFTPLHSMFGSACLSVLMTPRDLFGIDNPLSSSSMAVKPSGS